MKRALLLSLLFAACTAPSPQQTPPQEEMMKDEGIEENESDKEGAMEKQEEMMEDENMEEAGPDAAMEDAEDGTVEDDDVMLEEEIEGDAGADAMEAEAEEAEEVTPSAARVIPISAGNWSFAPAVITAKKGEMVELRITGVSGEHGFAVPSLGINVPINAGETKTVALPTTEAGSFGFLCNVPCGAGHQEMRGTIAIEP